MTKSTKIIAIVALICMGVIRAAFAGPKIETVAVVSEVKGDVQAQVKGQSAWVAVQDGMVLRGGDKIKTGPASTCVLKWNKDNLAKLTPFTNLSIDKLERNLAAGSENSSVDLWSGKVYAKARKLNDPSSTFEVKTPVSIAGVRGTTMSVEMGSQDDTTVECYEGSCYVKSKSGGEVILKEKEKTKVEKDKPPEQPKQMAPEDEKKFETEETINEAYLDIMEPVGNLETDLTPVIIKGKADPGAQVMVGRQAVTADQSGVFSASVDLAEGVNDIKIEATNKNGKTISKTRIIKLRSWQEKADKQKAEKEKAEKEKAERDKAEREKAERERQEKEKKESEENRNQEVQLTVSNPPDGYKTRESTITVTGTATPGADVAVNGIPAIAPGGSFSVSVTLVEGDNELAVTAKKWDKIATVTRTYTKDTTPPRLIIVQPGATFGIGGGCSVLEAEKALSCTVIGQTESDATLTINNARCKVESDGSFQQDIRISYEQATIEIAVADVLGNRTSTILTRVINRAEVGYLDLTVSPAEITADGVSTANISVAARNILNEPVNTTVMFSASAGGSLRDTALATSAGAASTVFTAGVLAAPTQVTITASAGPITTSRTIMLNPDRVAVSVLELNIDRTQMTADGFSTANITVNTKNILGEPVSGSVTLSASSGGTLRDSALTTAGGTASTVFTAGVGTNQNVVTITATCGKLSASKMITLIPDKPPTPGQ